MNTKSWLGLVLGPIVALATQSTLYSMVTPSCSAQVRLNLHVVAAMALLIAVILAVVAFSESSLHRREPTSPDHDGAHPPVPKRFLADIAAAVAGLSALVILAMWFTLWVLGPCEMY